MARHSCLPIPALTSPVSHRCRTSTLAMALAAAMLAISHGAAASTPVTSQFQVNTVTGSAQQIPAVATDAAGNFVVVWESYASGGNDASARSVQFRRFNALGAAIGSDFQVNTSTANEQKTPAVAMNASGAFVVVWESNQTGTDFNIVAQRYDASGTKVGTELLVNSAFTAGDQTQPAVAMANSGDFVVVWRSQGGAGSDPNISIQGRRWRAASSAFSDQFLVNDVTAGDQDQPAIATDGALRYVVAWTDPATSLDIAIRFFTADDFVLPGIVADAPQATANTYPTGAQSSPAVAMTPDGRAVVAWDAFGSSFGTDADRYSVQYRRIAANRLFLDGNDVQANTYTTSDQRVPSVSVSGGGVICIAWHSYGSTAGVDTDYSVQLRALTPAGFPLDPVDVQANTYTSGYQWYPGVAIAPTGRALVVWESNGSPGNDTNGTSIQGRLFDVFIFTDGFETGDTSRWSSTTP